MSWIFVALIAPLLWSIVNHVDKFLLSRYFQGGGAGGLMIFVGLIALPLGGALLIIEPHVLAVPAGAALILVLSGILYNVASYFYLLALEKEEASYVVPLMQLVPVFAYAFGLLFLSEELSIMKLIGGGIVIVGAFILSLRLRGANKLTFSLRTTSTMIAASLMLALGYVLFKDSHAETAGFTASLFWNQVGMLLFGFVFFLIPHFRREFLGVLRKNSSGVLAFSIGEQIIEMLGVVANNFAILLAPAALVILVEYGAQPVFVFAFGILGTLMLPSLMKEDISRPVLIQKAISILIMGIGLAFVL